MFGLSSRSALVAHQGGWDEVLLIGGPLLAIVGLLLLAKRRVERVAAESPDATSSGPDSASGSDPGSDADASASSASPE
jgi:hypothetical protein